VSTQVSVSKSSRPHLKEGFPSSYLHPTQLDIEDDISIASASEYIKAQYGKLDALINNGVKLYPFQKYLFTILTCLRIRGTELDQQLNAGKTSAREMWNRTYDMNVVGAHILT
jgi:NAD(P)-dependent dehydrogenase (short-subunit alcohol dehydrogenase family)